MRGTEQSTYLGIYTCECCNIIVINMTGNNEFSYNDPIMIRVSLELLIKCNKVF